MSIYHIAVLVLSVGQLIIKLLIAISFVYTQIL